MLQAELKPARYHLLLVYKILVSGEALPPLNSHEIARMCEGLMDSLWDDDASRTTFETATEHVRAVAAGNLHRDNIRTEPFTESLLKRLKGM